MRIKTTVKNIIISLLAHIWVILFANRKLKKWEIHNILLIFPYGIGNTVLTNGALRSIKKHCPDSQLTAIYMQKPTGEMLTILSGFKNLIYYDMGSNKKENNRFIKELSDMKFDVAINFFAQGSYIFNRMLMYAKVPIRIGFQLPEGFGGFRSVLFLSHYIRYDSSISEFKNDLNLLNILNIPLENSILFSLNKYNIVRNNNKVKIGIHVGRPNPKRPGWPVGRFTDLILLLKKSYNAEIYVFGGQEEEETSAYLDSKLGDGIINLIGKKSLEETIDYIHSMNAFASNDTGLMHIAASQGVPLVAIFGPTDILKNNPIVEDQKKLRVIKENIRCSPCYPLSPKRFCKGQMNCLNNISAEWVFNEVNKVLHNI